MNEGIRRRINESSITKTLIINAKWSRGTRGGCKNEVNLQMSLKLGEE